MKIYFDHEKLDVYREAIDFCGWVGNLDEATYLIEHGHKQEHE
jgi:hypothetical protein